MFSVIHLRRAHLCGFDINLTYPQNGIIPTLNPPVIDFDVEVISRARASKSALFKRALVADIKHRQAGTLTDRSADEEGLARRNTWKRDLSGRANGTLDPWYGCLLMAELEDYALNFSLPWSTCLSTPSYQFGLIVSFTEGHDLSGFDVGLSGAKTMTSRLSFASADARCSGRSLARGSQQRQRVSQRSVWN